MPATPYLRPARLPGAPSICWAVYAGFIMKKAVGELALIERIRTESIRSASGQGWARALVLGIGDDCAILRPPRGHEILVTTDFSLEGRHFRRDWHPAESVGHRALARGLSDLAAMGARPLAAFLSLALPREMLATRTGRLWVDHLFSGLRGLAEAHGVPLAGGDTSESPSGLVLADIVLVGSAPAGHALRRSGGHAGDALYVTGWLGGAAAEQQAMERRSASQVAQAPRAPRMPAPAGIRPNQPGDHPHLLPQPRIGVGLALVRRGLATAAIDVSDGLSTDLTHLCHQSGLGAEIIAAALPIHPLALNAGSESSLDLALPLDLALNGGEDYELLFSAPASVRMPRSIASVPITRIGRLVRRNTVVIVDSAGRKNLLKPGGWEHFCRKQ